MIPFRIIWTDGEHEMVWHGDIDMWECRHCKRASSRPLLSVDPRETHHEFLD